MASLVRPKFHRSKEGFGSNLGSCLHLNEYFHAPTCHQGREHEYNVSLRALHVSHSARGFLLSIDRLMLILPRPRLLGGILMSLIGVLYLLLDRSILSSPKIGNQHPELLDGLSRGIVGAQIGLIVLAMIVTRSSVISIQSKRGLPFGNQVIGWTVLSMEQKNRLPCYRH